MLKRSAGGDASNLSLNIYRIQFFSSFLASHVLKFKNFRELNKTYSIADQFGWCRKLTAEEARKLD